MRYMAGLGTGVKYAVHRDSLVNLVRGITERVLYVRRGEGLVKPPQARDGVFVRLSSIRKRLLKKVRSTPLVALDDYPLLYDGRKRVIYQSAVDSLKLRGLTSSDAKVSTFVKAEKVNLDAKVDPAPRVIQPRSPRYNVEVGRYLKLFEKELFRGFARVWGYPVVLKGLNAQAVGGWMATHWSQFDNPVAIGLDASRFDQHVGKQALSWEHSVYVGAFGGDQRLAKLLRWQLTNHGVGRAEGHKVEYTVEGCRMSGDINTGLGNCLLMSCIVIAYCELKGLRFRLANNGDDCVLFVDKSDQDRLSQLDSWFLDFGFTLTREPPVYELEHVEFCQTRPIRCADGWRMVRDPRSAMSKDCVSLLGWASEAEIKAWAMSVGTCGRSLTRGVPVWESWYDRLIGAGGSLSAGVDERVRDSGFGYMSKGMVGCQIDDQVRVSFWRAFGITPDFQESLEQEYRESIVLNTSLTPVTSDFPPLVDQQNPLTLWLEHTRSSP